jgi:TRAP-type C4-dicarboxylate transport system permease small subunit
VTYRLLSWLARACTIGGALALAVMMLGTDWDIIARQLAGRPLNGVVDLVETTVLASAMLGLPEGFLRDEQIKIDLLDAFLPAPALRLVKAVGLLLTMLFLALLCRNVWQPMLDARMFGDVKYDLGVPVWPLYALIVFAFAASVLTCAALFWSQVVRGEAAR